MSSEARLFKMLLTEMVNRDIFVDSDNLTHLDVLFDTLARDTQRALPRRGKTTPMSVWSRCSPHLAFVKTRA